MYFIFMKMLPMYVIVLLLWLLCRLLIDRMLENDHETRDVLPEDPISQSETHFGGSGGDNARIRLGEKHEDKSNGGGCCYSSKAH